MDREPTVTPQVIYHMYWERKEKFLLYEDIYTEWTIFAVVEGSFYYEVGELKGTAGFGDIVVCPPNTAFRRVIVSPLSFHFIRVQWTDEHGHPIAPAEEVPAGKLTFRNLNRLSSSYSLLIDVGNSDTAWNIQRINHYVQDIWYLYCVEAGAGWQHTKAIPAQSVDPCMQKAASLIEKMAFQEMSLKRLALELQLSPAQFTKKYKKTFGMTPIQHLTAIRLDKAKSLLLETKLTLDQISECCGYPNGFYLNRVFTKHIKETPSQYRRVHRV